VLTLRAIQQGIGGNNVQAKSPRNGYKKRCGKCIPDVGHITVAVMDENRKVVDTIVITKVMLAAGLKALEEWDHDSEGEVALVAEIFWRMLNVSPYLPSTVKRQAIAGYKLSTAIAEELKLAADEAEADYRKVLDVICEMPDLISSVDINVARRCARYVLDELNEDTPEEWGED
jgi:hypothetical protein